MVGQKNDGLTFKTVILSFLYRLSEVTSTSQPIDYLVDSLWALLKPFTTDEDDEAWANLAMQDPHQASITKLRIISLVLYRKGVLPQREYIAHRKYAIEVKSKTKTKAGLSSFIVEDIAINQFFMRHLLLISIITKNYSDYSLHLDVLWGLLSPYVTEEDDNSWVANNNTYGKEGSWMYDAYRWKIEKVRICAVVLDRSDFLWQTGISDEPDPVLGEYGNEPRI